MQDQLQILSEERNRLGETINELKSRIISSASNKSDLKVELVSRQADAEDARRKARSIENKLKLLSTAKTDLERRVDALNEDISLLNSKNRKLEKELSLKTKKINVLKKKGDKIAKESDYSKDLRKQIAEFKATLKNKDRQIVSADKKIARLQVDYGRLKKDYDNKIRRAKEAQAGQGKRAQEVLSLQEKLNKQKKDVEAMEIKVDTYIREIALLREEYVGIKLDNASLADELGRKNRRLLSSQAEVGELMRANSILREKVNKLTAQMAVKSLPQNKEVTVEFKSVNP